MCNTFRCVLLLKLDLSGLFMNEYRNRCWYPNPKNEVLNRYIFLLYQLTFTCWTLGMGEFIDKRDNLPRKWLHNWITLVAQAIGPNKSKKIARLIVPARNIHSKVWKNMMYLVFHLNFAEYIVCRPNKACEILGFVWINCLGN